MILLFQISYNTNISIDGLFLRRRINWRLLWNFFEFYLKESIIQSRYIQQSNFLSLLIICRTSFSFLPCFMSSFALSIYLKKLFVLNLVFMWNFQSIFYIQDSVFYFYRIFSIKIYVSYLQFAGLFSLLEVKRILCLFLNTLNPVIQASTNL